MKEAPTENSTTHFNGLGAAQAEVLALLSEESAEVVQAVSKILRHGLLSYHPESGDSNLYTLEREIGDLLAALRLAENYRLLDWGRVIRARDSKLMRVQQYLHHAKVIQDE